MVLVAEVCSSAAFTRPTDSILKIPVGISSYLYFFVVMFNSIPGNIFPQKPIMNAHESKSLNLGAPEIKLLLNSLSDLFNSIFWGFLI